MKAVITGITGLRNRGVEAMVNTTIEELALRRPHLSVDIVTETPDYDRIRLGSYNHVDVTPAKFSNPRLKDRKSRIKAKLAQFYKPFAPKEQASNLLVDGASLVIASGGDMFSSDYGVNSLRRNLQPLELALNNDIPVVFLAHSIGPFKTDEEAEMWLQVAQRSQLITVREQLSYKYITEDLGLSTNLVQHTADAAFLLAPPSQEMTNNLLMSLGIDRERPVIALAVSQGISRYADGCDYEQHLDTLHQVIQMLLNELDVQVLLIPHVQEVSLTNDDRIIATTLHRRLNFHPQVRVASGDYSASEFKGLIGACDMVIAERMHAAIAGLSSGVCTVVVGYSVKAEGIMTDLLGATSLQNDLVIPLHQFLDVELASKTIHSAWNRRHEVVSQLNEIMPQIKKRAAINFDLTTQICN